MAASSTTANTGTRSRWHRHWGTCRSSRKMRQRRGCSRRASAVVAYVCPVSGGPGRGPRVSLYWLTGVTLAGMAGRVRVREISDDEGNHLKTDRMPRVGVGDDVATGADVGRWSWAPARFAGTSRTASGAASSCSSALHAQPAPAADTDRDRLRQLQPAPFRQERQARRAVGRGQQRRDRLHAHELLVDEPPRMPVHRVARVRPQWHRPRHPPRREQHDPPLHRLAEPPHRRPPPAPHRQTGNRSLIRHWQLSKRNLAPQRRTTMTSPASGAPAAPIHPDYVPIPRASLGPPVNDQGYYVGR